MPKYKVSVSKNQKKYTIVLSADSDVLVRKKVHEEWYSILSVEEIDDKKIEWHKFIFEAVDINWNIKKWKVVWMDPFKIYVKLKEWLKYNIKNLYSENNELKSDKEKLDILKHLEWQYELYHSHNTKNKTEKVVKEEKIESKNNLENFYMKKELEETYRLIDFVLIKLKNILDNVNWEDVNLEKKEKIKKLYNWIIKIKKTTNIAKLKEVWELALRKVWEIELLIVEKNKGWNSRKLLSETNSLLKKLGSKEQFIEKKKDLNFFIKNIFWDNFDKKNKTEKKKKRVAIDKQSSSYWKTELLIKKYSIKKKEIKKEIFKKTFFIFSKEKRQDLEILNLKLNIINQNITILNAKLTGKIVSYTKIIKWYKHWIELLLLFFKIINTYLLWFIYFFSIIIWSFFILTKNNLLDISLNIDWVFILIYILFWSFLIFISRWMFSLLINFAIFIFMIILWVVNF
jgi:hypothetical protein